MKAGACGMSEGSIKIIKIIRLAILWGGIAVALGAGFSSCVTPDSEDEKSTKTTEITEQAVSLAKPPPVLKVEERTSGLKLLDIKKEPEKPLPTTRPPLFPEYRGHKVALGFETALILPNVAFAKDSAPKENSYGRTGGSVRNSEEPWHPLLLASFTRAGKDLVKLAPFGQLWILAQDRGQRNFNLKDSKRNLANDDQLSIDHLFVAEDGTERVVRMVFSAKENRLRLLFLERGERGESFAPLGWPVKFVETIGSTITGPQEVTARFRGSLYVQCYLDNQVFGFVSSRPFDVKEQSGDIKMTFDSYSENTARRPEIFDIFFGSRASSILLAESRSLFECIHGSSGVDFRSKSVTDALTALSDCQRNRSSSFLTLGSREASLQHGTIPYPLYIFNQRKKSLLYLALKPGSAFRLPLPRDDLIYLSSQRSGTSWDNRAFAGKLTVKGLETLQKPKSRSEDSTVVINPRAVPIDNSIDVTIPARRQAEIEIHPATLTPSILMVEALDAPRGSDSRVISASGEEIQRLSRNTFLSRGKVRLTLFAGRYRALLITTRTGIVCDLPINARYGRKRKHRCPKSQTTVQSAASQYVSGNLGPIMGMKEELLLGATGSLFWSEHDSDLSKEVKAKKSYQELSPKNSQSSLNIVTTPVEIGDRPILRVWHDAKDKDAIQKRLPDSGPQDLQKLKLDFPNSIVELMCISPGMNLQEFRQILNRWQPDAIQVFGCGQGELQDSLLNLVADFHRRSDRQLLLTPVGWFDTWAWNGFIPQMKLKPRHVSPLNSDNWWKAVHSGDFSLSAGALIESIAARRIIPDTLPSDGLKPITVELAITLSHLPHFKPRVLLIYSEFELVKKKLLFDLVADGTQIITNLSMSADTKWIQVVVRGSGMGQSVSQLFSRGSGYLMAASNFLPVAELTDGATPPKTAPLFEGETSKSMGGSFEPHH
jgi:hypothetical protein